MNSTYSAGCPVTNKARVEVRSGTTGQAWAVASLSVLCPRQYHGLNSIDNLQTRLRFFLLF